MPIAQMATDTIVAPATASGEGAIAIIRLSGPGARPICEKMFITKAGRSRPIAARRMTLGKLVTAHGDEIDEALVVVFPGPRSFTGEDVVEFHTHGGRAVARAVVDAVVSAGARLAEPGEFSRRAFLNGRMDLSRAEAVADLIAAKSERARVAALRQLRGGLETKIRDIRENLLQVAAEIEARIDFPDEDIPAEETARLGTDLRTARCEISRLAATFAAGRLERDGIRVVLAGKPNSGKSSLFNALLGRERAIVTPHPGTTRDTLEASIEVAGYEVTLVDTAGLRETSDEVESIGIKRSYEEVRQADLVLHLMDSSEDADGGWMSSPEPANAKVIPVATKWDMRGGTLPDGRSSAAIPVSVVTGEGLAELAAAIVRNTAGADDDVTHAITSERHLRCLVAAMESVDRCLAGIETNAWCELVMVDMRDALQQLGAIIGTDLGEDILDRVFSRFCIGK